MKFDTLFQRIADLQNRVDVLNNSFNYTTQLERLGKIGSEIEKLERERLVLEKVVQPVNQVDKQLSEQRELLELAREEIDNDTANAVRQDLERLEQQFSALEINLFYGEMDARNAFLDIQSGTGGTEVEAQDWVDMLLRIYLRWAEQHGFAADMVHYSPGEVAGAKSVAIHVVGEYAYGWLRTEMGKHRLVRQSPFDSKNRRYTSFVQVSVVPEVDDNVEFEINPTDLRLDTYRATSAGGPHIQKSQSAIRITHLPTDIVVQCEQERSFHKNKAFAMKYLKAKLFDLKMQQRNDSQSTIENSQPDMNRIPPVRSYVLDKSYIEDLRTGLKTEEVWAVLAGDLDDFIKACLKSGL
ncbi:MAG: peptide chain release factor 2 [Candidatus Parabeggiatoa sp. nov. 1]|nr:MAG: peptide chain release factor 2 [Gammaproteobacteria bacterium]